MRIGIDATPWTNWRGFGRFTRSIVEALLAVDRSNEYVLFFDRTYPQCAGVPSGARHVVVPTSAGQSDAISVEGRRSAGDLIRMAAAVAREPLDLFFSPSIDSYFPLLRPKARIVMIHDVIPETLAPLMLPDEASQRRRRLKVRIAIRQARVVATGSEYVGRKLVEVFGIDRRRVAIIPYGVADRFQPPPSLAEVRRRILDRHTLGSPYLLHVGGFGPNKNIPRLLDAFSTLLAQGRFAGTSLAFVGKRDADAVYDESHRIDRQLERDELKAHVRFLGFQADDELLGLYQGAAALVLPSLAEGFGLPAIEAVACGTPAIVTVESPLPALLGDAACAVDPLDEPGLVHALERSLTEEGRRRQAASKWSRMSWEGSARAALAVFEEAMAARR